jgi:hypothetical protein
MSALFPKLLSNRRESRRLAAGGPPGSPVIAHWSGNVGSVASITNRAGGTVGAMVQATTADQPELLTLQNGVKYLRFDGAQSDMNTSAVARLKATGPKRYWAFHLRLPVPGAGTIYSEWSEGGASVAERMKIETDASNDVQISIAINSIAFAFQKFSVPLVTQQAGPWVEVLFDGTQATAANRLALWVDGAQVSPASSSGTLPALLQAGDAVSYWLGSQSGSSNKLVDVAHLYIASSIPGAAERAYLRAFEAPIWDHVVYSIPAVTAWFAVADAVVSGGKVTSIPDRMSANAAIQATDARRMVLGAAANGAPILQLAGSQVMTIPLSAPTNGATQWGLAMHYKANGATLCPLVIDSADGGSASSRKVQLYRFGGVDRFYVYNVAGTQGRMAQVAALWPALTWAFVTHELNLATGDPEASRCVISRDGSALTLTFTNQLGTPNSMPVVVGTPTGSMTFGAANGSGLNGWVGDIGPHMFLLGSSMPGITAGLLKSSHRRILGAVGAPS